MERCKKITIIILLAIGALGTVTLAKSSSTLLQEGLYAEQVDGDINAAIRIYEKIIKDSSAQRSHIAQALYRQGMCYLKKQDEGQAKIVLGKLVEDYSDQRRVVNKAKPLLEELGNADPAALMPPETLIYMETGSPGSQIETILNMLKGTPLENPLAMLGGGQVQKSAGGMVSALMNPAMMAEFKKIRGMGVGVTGVAQNEPPVIAVLFPGKSDALRGLILAGLGFLGTPGDPIEGMQSIVFNDGGGAAYDETTVIIASPKAYSLGQLTWSVKQYKGVASKPTLASSNKSFAKISKKARQENALTLWTNFDEVFAGLLEILPAEMIPGEIHLADGVADFKNIDDLIVFFNIQEDGIALEHNISFKDGHNCLAYNMIRTPNLSRAGFEAVPSEAVGLLGIALGQAGSAQSAAASNSIKNFTGLDIGREIFTNIEQINLFALPPDNSSNGGNTGVPPIASNLGLAVTSRNPQQTREILTQLLTVANLVAGQADAGQPADSTGKYQIGLVNNQKLYCYMNQMNKTTVISLNPEVVETSVSAIKRRRSVCTAGPLNEAVKKLSPSTSKLVLVNVGGGIRIADAFLTATYNNPQNPAHKTLAQLAKACDKTSIQLGTDERINNFNVRLSIDQLPPLDNLFPMLMQLSQTDPTAKAMATKPQPREGATIGLDSLSKLKWKSGINAKSHKIYFGTQADQLLLLAEVKSSSHDELPALEEGTMYYWRVDEVWADDTVITGDVWSFTIGSLAALWKLDGDVKDSSGNGNDGTVNGEPSWVEGRIGGALKLDGVDDYVETDYKTDIPVWTVVVWVNSPSAPKSASPSGPVNRQANYQINWNHIQETFRGAAGMQVGGNWYAASFGELRGGTWYHLAATYDGENIKTYKDGVLITNNSDPSGAPFAENESLKLGRHAITRDYFSGTIDDVRIYDYALSESEIKSLHNEGK
ncbi:MAG: tetratricopeptide repeat protein [Planctomycetes bacterium]|nr:tetratricopeptide repeat protein [Planctomycetota bacterium]